MNWIVSDTLYFGQFAVRETSAKALGRLLIHQTLSEPSITNAHSEIIPSIVSAMQDDSSEVRRRALSVLKSVAKVWSVISYPIILWQKYYFWYYCMMLFSWYFVCHLKFFTQANPTVTMTYITVFGPSLADCLKDASTPVRLAAERCALHAFQLTKGVCMHLSVFIYRSSIFSSIPCLI